MAQQKILRLPSVLEVTGLSRTTVWRMVKRDNFPAPIKLGQRAVGWRASEIEAWIQNRPVA